jgi:hypothetical protein
VTYTWTAEELERIGATEELQMASLGADATPRRPVPIWVVRAGADLWVRSWRGDGAASYRAAKARRQGHVSSGGVEPMVTARARATTLKLVPTATAEDAA